MGRPISTLSVKPATHLLDFLKPIIHLVAKSMTHWMGATVFLLKPMNSPLYVITDKMNDLTSCYSRYFSFNRLNTFSWMHLILSRHVIILSQGTLSLYLFSHEISISLMLSQPSFNFHAVHGYAYFSSLPFWYLMHHTCYASILCIAYLISAPTAQGLGFPLCIQYR